LEFLQSPSTRFFNLRPVDGVVRIRRDQLAVGQTLLTVAVVDGFNVVVDHFGLSPPAVGVRDRPVDPAYRDVRLFPGLDSESHLTEHRLITVVQAGESKVCFFVYLNFSS